MNDLVLHTSGPSVEQLQHATEMLQDILGEKYDSALALAEAKHGKIKGAPRGSVLLYELGDGDYFEGIRRMRKAERVVGRAEGYLAAKIEKARDQITLAIDDLFPHL